MNWMQADAMRKRQRLKMTANGGSLSSKKLIKSFCRGSRGAVFSKRAPLVAEGVVKK